MLVTCHRFGDWFLFGLVWQYSSIQKNIIKVGAKSWMLTCSCHITLSLPFYTNPDSKRELNFCNGYLSLLYFWSPLLSTSLFEVILQNSKPTIHIRGVITGKTGNICLTFLDQLTLSQSRVQITPTP